MPNRQTLPAIWLMSDSSMGEALWRAIERVPSGGGVVLRHHRSDLAFAKRVAAACRERGLMLAVAGDVVLAREIGAPMVHNPDGEAEGLLVGRSVHDPREAKAAAGAELVFVSPLFATRSHPGAKALGMEQALLLVRMAGVPAIALGGMDEKRGNDAIRAGFHGWAAIRAWSEGPLLRS
jgi:thiamine-phosphate pyrophosphorylase